MAASPDAFYEADDSVGGATQLEDMLIEVGVRDAPRRAVPEPDDDAVLTVGAARELEGHLRLARRGDEAREEIDGEAGGRDEELIEEYRRRRIAEMRARAAAAVHGALREVEPADFEDEVREASRKAPVVLLLALPRGHPPSDRMRGIVERLAQKFPAVKFCCMQASGAVRNFPPEDAPAVMAYREAAVVAQFARLEAFAGASTNDDVVEWDLAQRGVLPSEMDEDPRSAPGFGRMNVRRVETRRAAAASDDSSDDDSSDGDDSDW
jgi:hypothetical protein